MKKTIIAITLLAMTVVTAMAVERQKLNFNAGWLLKVGDIEGASNQTHNDKRWPHATLPYAFNGNEAYRKDIVDLTDTVVWYRKHFTMTDVKGKKVIVE